MTVTYRRSAPADLPHICRFWREHWGDEIMVVHGLVYHPRDLRAFIAEQDRDWVGLVTYTFMSSACEIVSLDSLCSGQGIGSRLIAEVVADAKRAACNRLFLVTTNDNLDALGFYQRRGFELVRINRGAIHEARKIKPGIPPIGEHGIPLRDEIELEMILS
jgi:N-acetylglutamate synthase-like GNAT family acetyltransferase